MENMPAASSFPAGATGRTKGTNFYQSTLILSDDGGRSFRAGGVAMEKSDECMLAELPDGALVMAIRRPPVTARSASSP